jgi:Protein of unknown function (DUF4242)
MAGLGRTRRGSQLALRAQNARRGYPSSPEVVHLPKYLIDRNFSKITEDELAGFARDSKRIARERFHDVTWHHSHVVINPDGVVHTFCIYSAPDEARIREHAVAFGGHSIDWISVIADEVDPDEIAV